MSSAGVQGNQKVQRGYRVDAARLREFCAAVARDGGGLSGEDAWILADVLVRTDLRGVHTHGATHIGRYIARMRMGGANPDAGFVLGRESASTALVNGDYGVGQVLSYKATLLAMEKAAAHDVGVVLVRDSTHFGAAGHYALMCAEAGFVGLAFSTTPAVMIATGSRGPAIGNGPSAYGFPTEEGPPVVLDIAMSVTAGNVIRMARERGEQLRPGSAVDGEGRPTTDPQAARSIVPIGGYKGYGLALLVELLAGCLSGSVVGVRAGKPTDPEAATEGVDSKAGVPGVTFLNVPLGVGHAFIAINAEAFIGQEELRARVSEYARELHDAPKADGVHRIYLPGEMEHEREQDYLAHGISFDEVSVNTLRGAAHEHGHADLLEHAVREA
jgi:ureidoglycolate dehydrogenase (NAD+)